MLAAARAGLWPTDSLLKFFNVAIAKCFHIGMLNILSYVQFSSLEHVHSLFQLQLIWSALFGDCALIRISYSNNRGRAYETNKLPGNVAMLEETIKLLW